MNRNKSFRQYEPEHVPAQTTETKVENQRSGSSPALKTGRKLGYQFLILLEYYYYQPITKQKQYQTPHMYISGPWLAAIG